MTISEIITMAGSLVDETIDTTIGVQLVDNKIKEIEAERPWSYLKKTNSALTALSSDTYATTKTLPTDLAEIHELYVGDRKYEPISYENKEEYKDRAGFYYTDGISFWLTGNVPETKTITIIYKKVSDDVTSSSTPPFPSRFHKLLAFFLAAEYYILDAGEKSMSWHNELFALGESQLNLMRAWEQKNIIKGINTEMLMYGNNGRRPYKNQDNIIY